MTFSYFLKQWIRQSWDHLGSLFLIACLFFLTVSMAVAPSAGVLAYYDNKEMPVFPGGLILFASLCVGLWGICLGWLAFHKSVDQLLGFQDFDWTDYLKNLLIYPLKSVLLALFLAVGIAVLLFNLITYPKILVGYPLLRGAALMVTSWMLLFLGLVQIHLVSFLTHQDRPFRTALGRAIKVTVWKPFRTFFLLCLEIPAVLFIPPFCFILPGVVVTANQLSLLILLEDWQDPYEKTTEAIEARA